MCHDTSKITQWSPRLNKDENVRINIWDFGGQEIMHSTHQFFLTKRSLYLLVLNGRQGHEDADAEYWLSLIESFGEDSAVIGPNPTSLLPGAISLAGTALRPVW